MSARFDFVNCDRYRLAIAQGTTYGQTIIVKDPNTNLPRDLTNYSSTLTLKDCSGTVVFAPAVTVVPTAGQLTASADASVTALVAPGRYWYTWTINYGSIVIRELEGWYEVAP